jgi:hypothetical protein
MKYALDTEFIDTEVASHLISLAIVREDGEHRYFEFPFPRAAMTPWLNENVVPHLIQSQTGIIIPAALWNFPLAASDLRTWINKQQDPHPEFWAYYNSYDWYWLCRVMGGMMNLPAHWPHRCKEFADRGTVPQHFQPKHHALADARSLMKQMQEFGVARKPYDPNAWEDPETYGPSA